jgi:hypothetical protein
MRRHRRHVLPIMLAVAALVVAACGWEFPGVQPAPTPTGAPPGGPLVIVETRGGECPQGACGSTIVVEADGRVHVTAPSKAELRSLPADLVDALTTEISQTDFGALKSHPFTGTCPVAYDGQETVYTFATSSAVERIASCETAVDPSAPLFLAVAAALATTAVL